MKSWTISFFVEPVPDTVRGLRRWQIVRKTKFRDADTRYKVVSRHFTLRQAETRASGLNQAYGRN